MLCYRHLVIVTTAVVITAVVGFPARSLYLHWSAVHALDLNAGSMREPPLARWVDQEWYTQLFGTVPVVRFYHVPIADDVSQVENLRGLESLQVHLRDANEFHDSVWEHLPHQTKYLSLSLSLRNELRAEAWQRISISPALRELSVSCHPEGIDPGLTLVLPRMQRLQSLSLLGCAVSRPCIESIAKREGLEELYFDCCRELTDGDVEVLSHHPSLKRLTLFGSGKLTSHSLEFVGRMKSLREFCYSGRAVESASFEQGLQKLRHARPDVSLFELDDNRGWVDDPQRE